MNRSPVPQAPASPFADVKTFNKKLLAAATPRDLRLFSLGSGNGSRKGGFRKLKLEYTLADPASVYLQK